MEMKSPPPCPPTVTIRRNPHRKARATPSSAIPFREPLSSPSLSREIFSTELPQNAISTDSDNTDPSPRILSENLKVYLRIRPLTIQKNSRKAAESKNAWPTNRKIQSNSKPKTKKRSEVCVQVNEDLHSVTVSTPQALQETKRIKSEVYEGFSHVFASDSSQGDVYEEMVKPLVEAFLKGKSGMLAAMGPSGSGKTHTVFGCAREPGMVPLALRHIFRENGSCGTQLSRVFYLSMFEISSEKGKAEKMIDLLHDGGDIYMQHSVLKGLQEAVVSDAHRAESLIAHGMLKRATAMTNSNSQSSRSQCIINIRWGSEKGNEEVDGKTSTTTLTIVDLAGAEREKKTGNQGARLLESNFINNTSMVFGLCLRSLLEHQKNRNKPLQKHYQNSLLTRYMRDYLEGKKRMMLILTVKPGVEDYLDTSFLLRQASPFTKIKFKTLEEPLNLTCNKRPNQALPREEQMKKIKFSKSEASKIDERNTDRGSHLNMPKETPGKLVKSGLHKNIEDIDDEKLSKIHVLSGRSVGMESPQSSSEGDYNNYKPEKEREYQIMQKFSKALWTVLKQYVQKLEVVETENRHLRNSLTDQKTKNMDLEDELTTEKMRSFYLEHELKELKSQCRCCQKASTDLFPVLMHDASPYLSQYETAELQEVNSEVSSFSSKELEQTENEKKTDSLVRDSLVSFTLSASGVERHYPQKLVERSGSGDNTLDAKGLNTSAVDEFSRSQELSTTTSDTQDLNCFEDTSIVESSISEVISWSTSASLYTSHESELDTVDIAGDAKSLEGESECLSNGSCLPTSLECANAKSFKDFEDPKAKEVPSQLENDSTEHLHTVVSSSESPRKDDTSSRVNGEQLNNEEGKLGPLVAVVPEEGWDARNTSKFVPKLASRSNFQHTDKPKRRLLPASSVFLKDFSLLDIKDETDKPKGGRGGKRVAMDHKNRTQGSLSLLNLLTSKLNR
ncbi:kinesin-like protein KIN-6 isoform X2 [Sesamum indicum]|uniref:Kinesin-like protein KIN-6 isoform X2 n=1 Tax=Sesamum indicum TaxID=4182 RepID=A0A8M8UWA6_SESIN|nr:kinesin-like protein KIN-6 isoform X2 [Sesamum indicum]